MLFTIISVLFVTNAGAALLAARDFNFDEDISLQCLIKSTEIEDDISHMGRFSEWTSIRTRHGMKYRKKCPNRMVQDIDFCTEVCELNVNEKCTQNPTVGDDLCGIGLTCGSSGRCESKFSDDYSSDYSSSFDDLDLDYIFALLDEAENSVNYSR